MPIVNLTRLYIILEKFVPFNVVTNKQQKYEIDPEEENEQNQR